MPFPEVPLHAADSLLESRFEVLEGVSHWIPDLAPDQMSTLLVGHLTQHSER